MLSIKVSAANSELKAISSTPKIFFLIFRKKEKLLHLPSSTEFQPAWVSDAVHATVIILEEGKEEGGPLGMAYYEKDQERRGKNESHTIRMSHTTFRRMLEEGARQQGFRSTLAKRSPVSKSTKEHPQKDWVDEGEFSVICLLGY